MRRAENRDLRNTAFFRIAELRRVLEMPGKLPSIFCILFIWSAMFRWLFERRYVMANPFAGVKVRGTASRTGLGVSSASPRASGC
ncbi:integrase [Burkholderia sp. 117]|nr:integrase [Burkholderia sp. 136(2017)]PNX16890.1 integrase [Burkholderia sp. 129]PNX29388.1 integrase [Burkholderia sp. 137]PNX31062.1 integrase [Burkholderia sp. 117]